MVQRPIAGRLALDGRRVLGYWPERRPLLGKCQAALAQLVKVRRRACAALIGGLDKRAAAAQSDDLLNRRAAVGQALLDQHGLGRAIPHDDDIAAAAAALTSPRAGGAQPSAIAEGARADDAIVLENATAAQAARLRTKPVRMKLIGVLDDGRRRGGGLRAAQETSREREVGAEDETAAAAAAAAPPTICSCHAAPPLATTMMPIRTFPRSTSATVGYVLESHQS